VPRRSRAPPCPPRRPPSLLPARRSAGGDRKTGTAFLANTKCARMHDPGPQAVVYVPRIPTGAQRAPSRGLSSCPTPSSIPDAVRGHADPIPAASSSEQQEPSSRSSDLTLPSLPAWDPPRTCTPHSPAPCVSVQSIHTEEHETLSPNFPRHVAPSFFSPNSRLFFFSRYIPPSHHQL